MAKSKTAEKGKTEKAIDLKLPDFYIRVGTNEIYHKNGDFCGTIEHEEGQEVFMNALKHRDLVNRVEELEMFEYVKINDTKLDELIKTESDLTELQKEFETFKKESKIQMEIVVKALNSLSEDLKMELVNESDIEGLDNLTEEIKEVLHDL